MSESFRDNFGNLHVFDINNTILTGKKETSAVIFHTKEVPNPQLLQKYALQFLRYDNAKHELLYAQRNESSMPWGPNHVVGARIILRFQGKYLLTQETKGDKVGQWMFPGGTVQVGEKERDNLSLSTFQGHPAPNEVALQELYEEVGVDLRHVNAQVKLVAIMCFKGVQKQSGIFANDLAFCFLCDADAYFDNQPTLNIDKKEISSAQWMATDELLVLDETTNMTKTIVKHLSNKENRQNIVENGNRLMYLL